jgi:CotH protein.
VDGTFSSHLPLVVIEDMAEDVTGSTATARLLVYDAGDGDNLLQNPPAMTLDVGMRRLSDWSDEGKISYLVEMADPGPTTLLGLPQDSSWLLRGSLRDKSMLRNSIAYAFGRVLFPQATPSFRYCEVLRKQDGYYRYDGIYILAESDRHVIDSLADRMPDTPLLKYAPGQERRDELAVRSGNKVFTALQDGPDNAELQAARTRTAVDLAKLESALLALDPATFLRYETMLDEESVINLYILNMLMINAEDAPVHFKLYTNRDGKLETLPEWDFDESLDNQPYRDHPLAFDEDFLRAQPPSVLSRRVPVWRELENGGDIRDLRIYPLYTALSGENFIWFDRLFLSRPFLVKLYDRYHEVRRGPLSPDRIRTTIEELAFRLGPSLERDWIRWRREYTTAGSPYALRPFFDSEGNEQIRQTWSYDQEVVKIGHCLLRQDSFIRDQLERLDWMTADLYDKGSSGNRQAAYAFITLFLMMALMYALSKKL